MNKEFDELFLRKVLPTSSTSRTDLYSIYIAAHGELLCSSYCCPLYVRYLSGRCPLLYRTSTGQVPDMYRRCYLAVCLFHWRSLLGIIEVFTWYYRGLYQILQRYYRDMLVFFPCCMWDCILFGLQRYEFYLNQGSSSRGICLTEIVFCVFLVKYQ